jgi:hypothetical protein
MATRKSICDNLIQSKEVKEFIEANSNLTPDEIVKKFKESTREAREILITNRQADLKNIERLTKAKESLARQGKKQTEVKTNNLEALIDTSDVGLLRNMILNSSGDWYAGAGNSLETKLRITNSKYTNLLNGELEKNDVRIVNSGNLNKGRADFSTPQGQAFDEAIRIEWGILNGSGDKSTGNVKAKETAKALDSISKLQIKDAQAIGIKTGFKDKYAGTQTHNQSKISNISEKEYWDFTLNLLSDEQRATFEANKDISKNIYEILAGRNTKDFSIENLPLKSRESIKYFSNTRSLEFKNVEAEIQYHRRFGDTKDIIDITYDSLKRQSMGMASFEMFGFQRPEVGVEKLANYVWDNLLTQSQKDKLTNEKFGLEGIKQRLNADIEELLLGNRIPNWTVRIMQYQGARTLSGTVVNMMGLDIVAQNMQTFLRTGNKKALAGAVVGIPTAPFRVVSTMFKAYKNWNRAGLTKDEFYEASLYGYLTEGDVRMSHDFIAKDGVNKPKEAKAYDSFINFVHKLAGNTADNQLKQKNIKYALSKEFKDFTTGNFKGDEKIYTEFLNMYFTDNEISIIKNVKEAREGDGIHASDMRYIKDENIKPLVDDDIKKLKLSIDVERASVFNQVQNLEKEVKNADETIKKFGKLKENYDNQLDVLKKDLQEKEKSLYEKKRIELETKFSSMLTTETNRVLNMGGVKVRSIARLGEQKVSAPLALFLQLKTASISQYFDVYARIVNHPYFSNSGKIGAFAGYIAFTTLAGMMTTITNDMTNNWGEPKTRDIKELILEGLHRGGAGGILYDVAKSLLGKDLGGVFYDQRVSDRGRVGDILSVIGGPTGGQFAEIYESMIDLMPKNGKSKIDKALNTAVKSIPASNIFWYRAIVNQALMGLGEILQEVSGGTLQSTRRQNFKRRRANEEGLLTGSTPRVGLNI